MEVSHAVMPLSYHKNINKLLEIDCITEALKSINRVNTSFPLYGIATDGWIGGLVYIDNDCLSPARGETTQINPHQYINAHQRASTSIDAS